MSTFVLIHGAFHGSWCWEDVVPTLTAAGHRVITPDLPGRGGDATQTLDNDSASVAALVGAQPEPVILVGHCLGGVVVTAVAERVPMRLARLVYVGAFLPADGQSMLDLAKSDTEGALLRNLAFDDQLELCWLLSDGVRETLYHDCPEAVASRAAARLGRESLAVAVSRVETTPQRFGRVPRTYIECTDDRALGPSLQRRMHAAQPCRVLSLPSGHAPFFAQAPALAELLLAARV